MKKKSFLSGVNAKLALATVALTSVMFTSCEKEEFNVAPVELEPASATVAITVYDLADGSIVEGAWCCYRKQSFCNSCWCRR